MLMGRVDLHSTDIQFSTSFFDKFASNTKFSNFSSALDCGAGIGRISEYLLRNRFLQVISSQFRLTWYKSANILFRKPSRTKSKLTIGGTIVVACSSLHFSSSIIASGFNGY